MINERTIYKILVRDHQGKERLFYQSFKTIKAAKEMMKKLQWDIDVHERMTLLRVHETFEEVK